MAYEARVYSLQIKYATTDLTVDRRILILSSGMIKELPVGQENTGKKPIVIFNGALRERSTSEGSIVLMKNGKLSVYDSTTDTLVT